MYIVDIFVLWYYYSIGMQDYVKRNNNGMPHSEKFWRPFRNEVIEAHQALMKCEIMEFILELYDVLQVILKFLIILVTPQCVHFNPLIWAMVYPFILPVSMKLGRRYKMNRCIRNHCRQNTNHHCIYLSFYKNV